MIDLLRQIGLSELEARCYLTLHEEADCLSGYEVARRVSVSRTNVYAALRSLTDKGACRMVEGETVLYDAVPIEQLIRLLRVEFEQTAEVLERQLKMAPKRSAAFFNWQGSKPVESAMRRMVANTNRTVVVDLWAEDFPWIEKTLLDAEKAGVKVVLITLGKVETSLKHVIAHKQGDAWPNAETRKFSVLCDGTHALIGNLGGAVKPSALETDHPSVIELLTTAFYHDLIMTDIEDDFGPQLEEKYGMQYEKLLHRYKEEKGFF